VSSKFSMKLFLLFRANTTNENHVAQIVLLAVCGFSFPNWLNAEGLLRYKSVAVNG